MVEVDQADQSSPRPSETPSWLTYVGAGLANIAATVANAIKGATAALLHRLQGVPFRLRYFEDVLVVELEAINHRRGLRKPVAPLKPDTLSAEKAGLFSWAQIPSEPTVEPFVFMPSANPRDPDAERMVPQPIPCDAVGLALSGGGIRSAATCLGAIQALHHNKRLQSIDYLSTVSGGGYIGCCLAAAMSDTGGRRFPFDDPFGEDVSDNPALSHLRNFSNYLLPRGRGGLANIVDVVVVIGRGMLANLIMVLAFLLAAALATYWAYPRPDLLRSGSFVPAFLDHSLPTWLGVGGWIGTAPFGATLWFLTLLAILLALWAVLRSIDRIRWIPQKWFDRVTSDTRGWLLALARFLIFLTAVMAFLDLQPIAIGWIAELRTALSRADALSLSTVTAWISPFLAFAGAVTIFGGRLGRFLEISRRTRGWATLARRLFAQAAVLIAALIVPALIWLAYLCLAAWAIHGWPAPALTDLLPTFVTARFPDYAPLLLVYWSVLAIALLITAPLAANGYSLHRFYRDRLSKAFLFQADTNRSGEPVPLDQLLLSQLRYGLGPYPIINAALNVQGSAAANRRGRNAEFFTFTPHFVGSNLTLYAPTSGDAHDAGPFSMELVDPRLDLGTAMAISGAAISANMGGNTIRAMSPTLALLNVRLGYWLRNPRHIGVHSTRSRVKGWISRVTDKYYLIAEMLNQLDETKRDVYLTDGGHIENLGLYELLKRGCQLILAVDAEADPEISCASLLKVERFARIDLGVRIVLPWEGIARAAAQANESIAKRVCPRTHGPHTAVGRVIYPNGVEGLLVYFKASVTGDEKDYLLDYKLRNPDFPHEATGDQFFSEEQFEMYRALGFHIVQGFFNTDDFCFLDQHRGGFPNREKARDAVKALLPEAVWAPVPAAT